jgi:hypothetical protein
MYVTHLPFYEIETIATVKNTVSEGPDYFTIAIHSKTNAVIDFGYFTAESHTEHYTNEIKQLIKAQS